MEVTQAQLQSCRNKLKEYAFALQRINCQIENNPWDGLKSRTTGYEYAEKMQQELFAFCGTIDAAKRLIDGIGECPELFTSLSYTSLQTLCASIRNISSLPTVPAAWLASGKLSIISAQAEELKSRFEKLISLEKNIAGIFSAGIYDYDYPSWKDKLLTVANSFVGMPFIKKADSDFYIENHEALHHSFTEIHDQLHNAIVAFDSINAILGTTFVVNTVNQKNVAELIAIIGDNRIIPAQWFTEDLARHKALVAEAQINAARLLDIKAKLLSEWESDVLTLDYAPILLRYKTEYTNFFKIFKARYKQDRKQIRALSKSIIRKQLQLRATQQIERFLLGWYNISTLKLAPCKLHLTRPN